MRCFRTAPLHPFAPISQDYYLSGAPPLAIHQAHWMAIQLGLFDRSRETMAEQVRDIGEPELLEFALLPSHFSVCTNVGICFPSWRVKPLS